MPIEIRELYIKAVVSQENSQPQRQRTTEAPVNREKLVAECVDKVLEILRQKNER